MGTGLTRAGGGSCCFHCRMRPLRRTSRRPNRVQARVAGAQFDERAGNLARDVLHGASADGLALGRDASVAVPPHEDTEDGDGVVDAVEEVGEAAVVAELAPDPPHVVAAGGAGKISRGAALSHVSEEISAERIAGRRWSSRHGSLCG